MRMGLGKADVSLHRSHQPILWTSRRPDSGLHKSRVPATPRPMAALTAVSLALLTLGLVWAAFDSRLIEGSATWAKPMKFALSFAVTFGTLAVILPLYSPTWRGGLLFWSLTTLMGGAMLFEMIYMIYQAAQGQASHFNTGTAFTRLMYALMGVGAVTLVVAIGAFGWAALRDKDASFGPALRQGVVWGFIGSFILTMITAGTMSSLSGHFIGTPSPDSATVPLMGWSAAVGDLRPAHFVALHMMQALPLFGLWLDRRNGAATAAIRSVRIGSAVYAILTLGLFVQALMGLPVIRL